MLKRMKVILLILLVASLSVGCKVNDEGIKESNLESDLLNLREEAYDYENGNLDRRLGLGYSFTEVEKDLSKQGRFNETLIPNLGYLFSYTTDEGLKILEKLENEENTDEIIDFSSIFFDYSLLYTIKNGEKLPEDMSNIVGMFEKKEEIGSKGEYTYYFAWNEEFDHIKDLSEEDRENIKNLINNREKFVEESTIFDPVEEKNHMRDFNTKTIQGSSFTNENFSEYDLTLVNLWSTWCTGCIEEMPELQALYERLPENVNMISICADGEENRDLASNILNKNKCGFETILPDEKLDDSLMKYIDTYPTTLFVDSEGNIVGDMVTGAPVGQKESFVETYLKLIEDRLDSINRGE